MITKIERLKNIGNYDNYIASGNVALKRMSIIYAENGAGKTTLSQVFHSLATNDPQIISRHKRIGAVGDSEVEIRDETPSPITFINNKWNRPYPEMEVFDSHFVSDNVYSGFEINSDHHKNLYQFVIGANGVSLIKKIQTVKDKILEKRKELDALAQKIKFDAGHDDLQFIIELKQNPNIDKEIEAKQLELEHANNHAQILNHPIPEAIPNINISLDDKLFESVFGSSVEGIGQEYLKIVQAHLKVISTRAKHDCSQWVFDGVKMLSDNNQCPFCGQSLTGAESLLFGYNQYFSDTYKKLVAKANLCKQQIEAINIPHLVLQLSSYYKLLKESVCYWSTVLHADSELPEFPIESLQLEARYSELLTDVKEKVNNPVNKQSLDSLKAFWGEIHKAQELCLTINSWLEAFIPKIEAVKKEIRSTKDVEKELNILMIQKARYEPLLSQECLLFEILNYQSDRLQRINHYLQQQQKSLSTHMLQQYSEKINNYLSVVFNTPFKIVGIKDGGFKGQSKRPNLDYTLTFNGTDILQDDGLFNTSFKNVLSEGDKNTIALSFFLSKLESDPNISSKTIIFDDPLTSMDINRRHSTIDQLIRLQAFCKQLIVLSHNLHFLIDLNARREIKKADKKVLMIAKGGGCSSIIEYDLKRGWVNKYKESLEKMEDFLLSPSLDKQEEAINSVRIALELMLKLKYCKFISNQDGTFGEVVSQLENSACVFVEKDKSKVISDLNDLRSISWRYHHASIEEKNIYNEVILTMSEAQSYIKKALHMLYEEL